ncbi:MAG TPA: tRNA (N6-isopentenyl adenosine(37)-C2)-methylthiotransferase MiaB [bacterium]|nr:tRNA (N6-isopentenyl adenosine(37)-C2)-methylthiotransferase MiaB [bacterium]
MTYHITTYGCQMNTSDSERIASVLEQNLGLKQAPEARADILVYNLCSVRQTAVNRVWGNFKKTRGKRQPLIIFTGCILPPDQEKIRQKNCLVLDIKDLPRWPSLIIPHLTKNNEVIKQYNNLIIKQSKNKNQNYLRIQPQYSSSFTAYVPIMTGCNNFCSYCAVPYTRGREVSRPVEEIMTEISDLTSRGYREIILLGQNVNSYNSPVTNYELRVTKKNINFPSLLHLIDQIKGDFWLTFFTSHPKDLSPELIACFQNSKHLIPYLHLALQSGSNKILKVMNRKYTGQHFVELIKKVRAASPDICVSTDIIVGFPGETQRDFLATATLMKKVRFDMAYLAEYSPRPLTVAARLEDDIPTKEKTNRKNILNEILKTTALSNNQKMVNQTTEVLVSSADKNFLFGRTKNFKNVKIITSNKQQTINNKKIIGQFVKIKITKATAWNLEGELTSVGSGL